MLSIFLKITNRIIPRFYAEWRLNFCMSFHRIDWLPKRFPIIVYLISKASNLAPPPGPHGGGGGHRGSGGPAPRAPRRRRWPSRFGRPRPPGPTPAAVGGGPHGPGGPRPLGGRPRPLKVITYSTKLGQRPNYLFLNRAPTDKTTTQNIEQE